MDIALIITELEVGGAERALVELASRLDRQRFRPVVYCLGARPGTGADGCVQQLERAGVEVRCFGARGAWSFGGAVAWLRRGLSEQRPDVVQTFLFHANILGRMAARLAGRPVVVSGIRVAQQGGRWRLAVDRWTDGWVARHVCVSQSVARFSETVGGLPKEKLAVIPNGIDVASYPASRMADLSEFGVSAGRRVVTFVGRLEEQKGVDWLLASTPRWLGRAADVDLLLVGKGPEEMRLRRQIARMRLSARVHFAGWRADVVGILAASSVLVLPSRWEGMPNVVLEAMASRLPVLATDVEGVRELLGDEAEPQMVAFGDSQSLAEKLVALVNSASLSRRLGEANRRRVETEFSISRTVSAYEQLWESLVEQNP